MDKDQLGCLVCCEVVIGAIIIVGLIELIGVPGIGIGMGILVLLFVGTAYMQVCLKRNKLRAIQRIATSTSVEQLSQFQANAKRLAELFAMSTKVGIGDVCTIMEFDSRKETLDFLIALKRRVPGLMLDGELVMVSNVQELATALETYDLDPASEENTLTPLSWTCGECKHENPSTANYCEGCGIPRDS